MRVVSCLGVCGIGGGMFICVILGGGKVGARSRFLLSNGHIMMEG